jgi:protein SCO1
MPAMRSTFGRHGITPRAWVALGVAAALCSAIGAGAAWYWLRPAATAQPHFVEVASGAFVLPKPDALPQFQLVKHDGTPFHNQALKGRWSFMIFGYTHCPDFCPTTLVEFTHLHKLLAAAPHGVRDVQFVLVSVDPERDTPALLAQYVPQFNPEFIGVTGDAAMIARLAGSVGAVYARAPGSRGANYLIDHSTAVLLINPQGALQGVLAAPHTAKEMMQGFAKIREP